MTRCLVTLFILCLGPGVLAQQQTIQGSLKTTDGKPVPHASVTVRNPQDRIVVFKTSDASGNFSIVLPAAVPLDSLHLLVNHLGYAGVNLPISRERSHYDITLQEKPIDLSEVKVKSRPRIDTRGDTLRYDVGSFAKAEDRSIGDVLKRMPGMEVSESGQIKYNGQNISNFYIDGDDLLDDKYAIGTKTIPHAMVQKLEVLQNHQPLKVLKNKTLSDRVALNLVIKDEARLKLTGQVKAGAGLPHQYDSELNSILFNKKYKMLNVVKGNNVGEDLASDFTAFGLSDMLTGAGNSRPQALLSSGTAGNPPLPKQRYYFNNSGSLNLNNLVNLKNGLQLKANINGLLDGNDMAYNSWSELYLGNDTIRYSEWQDIGRDPFLTGVSLTAMANEEGHYFNNVFKLNYSGDMGSSALLSNDMDMRQGLHNRLRDFANTLEYTPALKNGNVINLYWYVNHFNQPQTLIITPGINEEVLNAGVPFAGIRQFGEIPSWFSRASAAYRLTKGLIRQRYRTGVINEWQRLHSALHLTQTDGRETPYAGSEDNNLHWQRHQFFLDGTYEYKQGPWEATATLPLAVQRIAYHDDAFALDESKIRLLFNPSMRLKRMMTREDYLSLDYRYTNHMGNINGVFRGAVLTNYRSMEANEADLQERDSHNIGLRYHFQRAISMLFMNAGVTYARSTANTIAASVVTDNIARTVLLPIDNDVSSVNLNAGLSKFIFALGATASLRASWGTSRFNQVLNGETLPFNNRSLTVNPAFEARLLNKVNFNYNGVATWTTSRLISGEASTHMPDRQIRLFDQTVSVSYSPFRSTFLRVNGRHQYTSQAQLNDISYFFADANIRYTLAKWRTDIELNLTNLADVTAYETYSLSANRLGYSHYQLRGSMAVLKVIFSL
ncbi:carboxypeptidase regulatory-like domain-containing protein [Parapedobacter sp. ISTM3]|uniref:carboxypeptidase-like regulatory domain-containing protein n=1 Tax=Parapedobacter sp. ISTM3 TaxID=2800130 RepID=UPI00190865EE|nr:carboxypeptidase-like regulatory domain-containing protein [Parapedobacter sp. ISTM3]MBK1442086.1 carboxypeptidase regulatory-like domain-containing protein [Parapedobacter sp. ISTM3]